MSEDISITVYHCCCDCNKSIDVPSNDPTEEWETGCLDRRGRPNRNGGLCRCDYYEGD